MRLNTLRLVAALLAVLMIGEAGTAEAQCTPSTPSETCVNVGADGKGILGGGIIGAEIGFMIPALIVSAGARELDEWWSWVLFPALGAAGGAVLGYFALEDPVDSMTMQRGFPEAAVAVLAVGIALIVPTFVGVLSLTSYSPSGDGGGQGASGDDDAAEDGEPAPSQENSAEQARRDAIRRTMAGGPGLVRFDNGELLLGVPMVHATDSFTAEERAHMRLTGMVDYRIPVVSGAF